MLVPVTRLIKYSYASTVQHVRVTWGPAFCLVVSACAPREAGAAPSLLFCLCLPPGLQAPPALHAPRRPRTAWLHCFPSDSLFSHKCVHARASGPVFRGVTTGEVSPAIIALPHEGPAPLAVPSFLSPFRSHLMSTGYTPPSCLLTASFPGRPHLLLKLPVVASPCSQSSLEFALCPHDLLSSSLSRLLVVCFILF